MVSEQLQSLGVSGLDIIMEDFNRIHDRMISILTKMLEAQSAHTLDRVAGISGDLGNVQGKGFEGHSPLPFTETAIGVSKVIKTSVTSEDSKQDIISGSDLVSSNDNVKVYNIVEMIEHKSASKEFLMTDETTIICEYSDDRTMEITGDSVVQTCPVVCLEKISWLNEEVHVNRSAPLDILETSHVFESELKVNEEKCAEENVVFSVVGWDSTSDIEAVQAIVQSAEIAAKTSDPKECKIQETGDKLTLSYSVPRVNDSKRDRIEEKSQNNNGLGILVDDHENEIVEIVGKENVGAIINDGKMDKDEDREWSLPRVVEETIIVEERKEKILWSFSTQRSASTVAAIQTMTMIYQLQEEKAAMQMEALQYHRMMEEQSEYDQEALQLLNELMVKREKEKQESEKELRPKDVILGEDATNEFEEWHNEAYATLHYLLNPRTVKRMRQLLTIYKEDIPTLTLRTRLI